MKLRKTLAAVVAVAVVGSATALSAFAHSGVETHVCGFKCTNKAAAPGVECISGSGEYHTSPTVHSAAVMCGGVTQTQFDSDEDTECTAGVKGVHDADTHVVDPEVKCTGKGKAPQDAINTCEHQVPCIECGYEAPIAGTTEPCPGQAAAINPATGCTNTANHAAHTIAADTEAGTPAIDCPGKADAITRSTHCENTSDHAAHTVTGIGEYAGKICGYNTGWCYHSPGCPNGKSSSGNGLIGHGSTGGGSAAVNPNNVPKPDTTGSSSNGGRSSSSSSATTGSTVSAPSGTPNATYAQGGSIPSSLVKKAKELNNAKLSAQISITAPNAAGTLGLKVGADYAGKNAKLYIQNGDKSIKLAAKAVISDKGTIVFNGITEAASYVLVVY